MCTKIDIPVHLKEGLTADEAAALTGLPVTVIRSEAYLARTRPKISDFPALWNGEKMVIPRLPLLAWLAKQGVRHTRFNLSEAKQLCRDYNGRGRKNEKA